MKDAIGQDIKVGDIVIYAKRVGSYVRLKKRVVGQVDGGLRLCSESDPEAFGPKVDPTNVVLMVEPQSPSSWPKDHRTGACVGCHLYST